MFEWVWEGVLILLWSVVQFIVMLFCVGFIVFCFCFKSVFNFIIYIYFLFAFL